MATLSPYIFNQFFTNTGAPLANGKIETYVSGSTTPKATYTDSTGLVANTNPIILDSAGRAAIWLDTGGYKFILKTSAGATIQTVDGIVGSGSGDQAGFVSTIADLRALPSGAYGYVHVSSYTTLGDGGEGDFYWDDTSTTADDKGIIIVPNSNPATGRWTRYISSQYKHRFFGNTANFLAWCALQTTTKDIEISATLDLGGLTATTNQYINFAEFADGATITNGTLTIGKMTADPKHNCFASSATISFASGACENVRARWFGANSSVFAKLITAASANGSGIIFDGPYFTCTDSFDFLNIPLHFVYGCYITLATTKTISNFNPIAKPNQKIIAGLGTFEYSDRVTDIYFEWRGAAGDQTTDDTTIIDDTLRDYIASTNQYSAKKIVLLGMYKRTTTITIANTIQIVGNDFYMPGEVYGYPQTGFYFTPASPLSLFDIDKGAAPSYNSKIILKQFFIKGNSTTNCKYAIDMKQIMSGVFENIGITTFQRGFYITQCAICHYDNIYITGCDVGIEYPNSGNFTLGDVWSKMYIVSCGQLAILGNANSCVFKGSYFENSKGFEISKESCSLMFQDCSAEQIPKPTDTGMLHMFNVGVSGTTAAAEQHTLTINGGKWLGNRSSPGSALMGDFIHADYSNGVNVTNCDISQFIYAINYTANTKDHSVNLFGNFFETVTYITNSAIQNKIIGDVASGLLAGSLAPVTYSKYNISDVLISPVVRLNTADGADNGTLSLCAGGAVSDAQGANVILRGNENGSAGTSGNVEMRSGDVAGALYQLYMRGTLRLQIDSSGNATTLNSISLVDYATVGGKINMSSAAADIIQTTSDGADSRYISICGGGANSDGRGARIRLFGNEHSTQPGQCDISGGATGFVAVGGDTKLSAGNFSVETAGKGIKIKEGSNARMGTGTLVSGTVVISNTSVTANTRIFLSRISIVTSSKVGVLTYTISAGTSFTVTSVNDETAGTTTEDVSTFNWLLIEPS